MRQLSAKDRAFERERQRLQKHIRILEDAIKEKDIKADGLHAALKGKDARIQELETQLKSLSKALSHEDFQLLLDSEKRRKELLDNLDGLLHLTSII